MLPKVVHVTQDPRFGQESAGDREERSTVPPVEPVPVGFSLLAGIGATLHKLGGDSLARSRSGPPVAL